MKWINVKQDLPKPFEVVWIFWRDREVLLGCRTYEDDPEGLKYDPSEGWYSFEDEKGRWTNFWQRVDSSNLDKPKSPHETIP